MAHLCYRLLASDVKRSYSFSTEMFRRRTMTQKTLRMLLVALVAILSFASAADAAPKKALRHRPKHSSRVASGSNSAPKGAAKSTTRKKKPAADAKRMDAKTAAPLPKKPVPSTKPRHG